MAVESDADRTVFLADFGDTVSWAHDGGAAVDKVGIIESGAFLSASQDGGPGFMNGEGTILMRALDLPTGVDPDDRTSFEDDVVTYLAVDHSVKAIEPDGTGMVLVRLEEIAS